MELMMMGTCITIYFLFGSYDMTSRSIWIVIIAAKYFIP